MLLGSDPLKLSGHDSNLRNCEFYGDNYIVSCSDDKTVRLWDLKSCKEIRRLEFPSAVSDLEVSTRNRTLTLTYGSTVAFWNLETLV